MKNIKLIILVLILCAGGCKLFEKKEMVSKDEDTILGYAKELKDSMPYNELNTDRTNVNDDLQVNSKENFHSNSNYSPDGKFHIVVGSFLIPQNAEYLVEDLNTRGITSTIIVDKVGFHMVSVASYSQLQESISEIPKYRNEIDKKAWVYLNK